MSVDISITHTGMIPGLKTWTLQAVPNDNHSGGIVSKTPIEVPRGVQQILENGNYPGNPIEQNTAKAREFYRKVRAANHTLNVPQLDAIANRLSLDKLWHLQNT